MTDVSFAPDEIGPWSEIKLEIVEKYGPAYTLAFSGKGRRLRKSFTSTGSAARAFILSKTTKAKIEGSPTPRA